MNRSPICPYDDYALKDMRERDDRIDWWCSYCGCAYTDELLDKLDRRLRMSDIASEIITAANQAAPTAPVVEVAEAALNTALSPSPANILSDLELAINLVKSFKAQIAGLHPSVINIIKLLF